MPTENAVDSYDDVLVFLFSVVSSALATLWNFGSSPSCDGGRYGLVLG
jgi:hypothetical protein